MADGREIVTVAGMREEFGISEHLSFVPPHRLELCRLQNGQLLARRLLDKANSPAEQPLKELLAELDRLASSGWPVPAVRSEGKAPETAVDGPQWRFYLVTRRADSMEARDLSKYPRVAGLISLLHQTVSGRGVEEKRVAAMLIDWDPLEENKWRTNDFRAKRLLALCGLLVPEPLPDELRAILSGKQDGGEIQVFGQHFLARKARP